MLRKLGLKGAIKRVGQDESGASMAEYAVLLIICAAAGVTGVSVLGGELNASFVAMKTWVNTNVTSALGG